jgi:hypothetical protein
MACAFSTGDYLRMTNKTWIIEVGVAVCILAVAAIAFGLMVSQGLWKSMAGK